MSTKKYEQSVRLTQEQFGTLVVAMISYRETLISREWLPRDLKAWAKTATGLDVNMDQLRKAAEVSGTKVVIKDGHNHHPMQQILNELASQDARIAKLERMLLAQTRTA